MWHDLVYSFEGLLLMPCGEIFKEFYSKEEQKKRTEGQCVVKGGVVAAFVFIRFFTLEIYQQVYVPVGVV